MKAADFFTNEQEQLILRSIENAEKNTSGEIRIHIESHCSNDVLDRAAYLFGKLNMHKTELRNGVLFYLAIADKKFAILGDAGINSKVPGNFWESVRNRMTDQFKSGNFTEGLIEGVTEAGNKLKEYFPISVDDINELPNEISFGK